MGAMNTVTGTDLNVLQVVTELVCGHEGFLVRDPEHNLQYTTG